MPNILFRRIDVVGKIPDKKGLTAVDGSDQVTHIPNMTCPQNSYFGILHTVIRVKTIGKLIQTKTNRKIIFRYSRI